MVFSACDDPAATGVEGTLWLVSAGDWSVAVSTTCVIVASVTVAGFVVGTAASELVTAGGSAAVVEATGVEATGVETSVVVGAAVDARGVEALEAGPLEEAGELP
jgi:hypothetical protein